ncbi:hypothetical protein, partial [Acinetobacter baumannii]|uniref:hypothetical protein n=1 Tax=Acinetobacter baumannii TaxID=470 RepID=UPI001C07DD70
MKYILTLLFVAAAAAAAASSSNTTTTTAAAATTGDRANTTGTATAARNQRGTGGADDTGQDATGPTASTRHGDGSDCRPERHRIGRRPLEVVR